MFPSVVCSVLYGGCTHAQIIIDVRVFMFACQVNIICNTVEQGLISLLILYVLLPSLESLYVPGYPGGNSSSVKLILALGK